MQFLTENWEALIMVLLAFHALAVLIVNLTPTPKDNQVLAKVYPIVEFLAGLVSSKAKQKPGETSASRSTGTR